ncbi:Gfo/Idh/MocA family oxidoreductase [uncultured Polaribacter sp.]|uniref:Gfo/Idh/MocA family protein n=1 Tax=uncultured Polaribacter sp. TaxID=174711 RepID=UPI00262CBE48|nr:Gfo/Idh/MocA family oxidoreductase [uncultured Polaribacter sp.]
MSKKNINWGIIGCGDVAEIKSGPAFYKVENSSLINVMRRNEEKVKDFAKRHKVANWTTNVSELINDKNVNAIYIATPPSSHLEYALQALKAGKDVYLEKPMVLNSKEAKVLSEAVVKGNNKVTIAHYRRSLPVFFKVKELLLLNTIGKVTSAKITIAQSKKANIIAKTDVNWRIDPAISGGGYFHDIAPHQLDLMYYYFGDIASIKSIDLEKNKVSNEVVKGEIQFKNGVQFNGSWDFNAAEDADNCTIIGEKGSISFSFYGEKVIVKVDESVKTYQFSNPKHVQQAMIEKTVGYFLGNNENPCTVNEAVIVTKIMDVFCGID